MQHILLLHGAIGAKEQLVELKNALSSSFHVHLLSFSGHGQCLFSEKPFSIKLFAEEVIAFLDINKIESLNIFGYSMGGYIGLYLAKYYPERINKVITLATKFNWNEAIAEKEIKMLNAEKIEEKLPAFADSLQKRHTANDWKTVLKKTTDMLYDMGRNNPIRPDDYLTIQHPTLLILGDRDKMVSLEETADVYKKLPNVQLSVIPNTDHPIETVNISRLAYEINSFLL